MYLIHEKLTGIFHQLVGEQYSVIVSNIQTKAKIIQKPISWSKYDSFSKTFSKFKVTRKMTLSCKAAVPEDDSQYIFVGGTLEATLSDTISQASIPMFPGISATKVRGKTFRILINDLHQMENGKIKKTWHAEDWITALGQMLKGYPEPLLDMPFVRPGEELTQFPRALRNFYDRVLSGPGMITS